MPVLLLIKEYLQIRSGKDPAGPQRSPTGQRGVHRRDGRQMPDLSSPGKSSAPRCQRALPQRVIARKPGAGRHAEQDRLASGVFGGVLADVVPVAANALLRTPDFEFMLLDLKAQALVMAHALLPAFLASAGPHRHAVGHLGRHGGRFAANVGLLPQMAHAQTCKVRVGPRRACRSLRLPARCLLDYLF